MIEYCEPFELTNWVKIKDHYKNIINKVSNIEGDMFAGSIRDMNIIDTLIRSDIAKYTGNEDISVTGLMLFCVPNKNLFEMPIHIDDVAVKYALNIPIHNYDNTTMYWYDEEGIQKEDLTGGYRLAKWQEAPKVVFSKVINTPHIVRIDKPHNAVNNGMGLRALMSVRFTPDLF